MTTSVVTGGAGFLGSHLCEYLLDKGHRVICLDNLDTGTLENIEHIRDDHFEFRNVDVIEHIDIEERVDFVFHLASPASPIDYHAPAAAHAQGRLVRDAQRARPGQVQAGAVPDLLDVGGVRRPARAPAEGDLLGQRQSHRSPGRLRRGQAIRRGDDHGLPPPAGRGHVHRAHLQHLRSAHARRTTGGPSRRSSTRRCENEPLTVFGDGSQTRSFCYVDDLVEGLYLLATHDVHEPVNLGNPEEHTLTELAELVHRDHRQPERDRLRGAADRRPPGAPAGHHARHRAARLDSQRVPARRHDPHRRLRTPAIASGAGRPAARRARRPPREAPARGPA